MGNSKAPILFKSYEEFWFFCFGQCRDFRVGCANSCELRKQLEIPPHGKSYLGKMKGEIEWVGEL
ncbi:MAG: hypothetical protein QXZ70_00995 [Candidatus Bathyarchaeia archaeon]